MSFAPKTQDPTHSSRSSQNANKQGGDAFFEGIQTKQDPSAEKADTPESFFQPKLEIHPAQDAYEVEADRVADQVLAATPPVIAPPVQMQQQEEEDALQSKPLAENITRLSGSKNQNSKTQRLPAFMSSGEQEQSSEAQGDLQAKGEMSTPPDHFEQDLARSKGGGSPLPDATRQQMETGFGTDFGNVRIHTNDAASKMSQDIGAQAFTNGNDIYFNKGKFQPGTSAGDHLLAHELTHTVQQGGVQRKVIQRAATTDINSITPHKDGKMERSGNQTTLTLLNFPVKDFPSSISGTVIFPQKKRDTVQYEKWKSFVKDGVRDRLVDAGMKDSSDGIYRLSLKNNSTSLIGTESELIQEVVQPDWDTKGTPTTHQIEHVIDWQLAGGGTDVDVEGNLVLLEAKENNRLGGALKKSKRNKIEKVLKHYKGEGADVEEKADGALLKYKIIAQIVKSSDFKVPVDKIINNEKLKSEDGPLSKNIISVKDWKLTPGHFLFKPQEDGPGFELPYATKSYKSPGYDVKLDIVKTGNDETLKSIELIPTPKGKKKHIKTEELPGPYPATALKKDHYHVPNLRRRLKNIFSLNNLSPIEIEEVNIGPKFQIQAKGKVLPTVPLIKDANIVIVIDGEDVKIGKEFTAEEIKMPKPFKMSDAFLGLYVNSEGFMVEGRVNFGIDKVGEGYLEGKGKSNGLSIEGEFNFDSKIFEPARVKAAYKDGKFSAEGEIGIPKGKIKGIKSANAKVVYTAEDLSVVGAAQLDIPGLKKSDLAITYQNQQLTIGGKLELGAKVPGLKSATGDIEVTKIGEDWKVKASGTAEPDIPGVTSSLNIAYDDGILDISAKAAYTKGKLAGEIQVGATNRTIGKDGVPGDKPSEKVTIYGSGKLALEITPWLKATAGVKLLPNGEVEVLGRIELPSNVEVFPRKEINRNLFSMPTIEIPLFAIPLGPKSLGLVAQINGGLDFNAGIGPGQIQGLFGEIQYNPAHPEATTLSGGGRFVIPADASLKLHADLTLGLSVGIASLTGGIELAASVGLQGEASAGINLNWNPTSGLELNAVGEVKVSPRFKFDVNLLARATLDLWIKKFSKEWRYNLASYEWGPGIEFGLRFPIHYKEGQPFNISFDDIQVIKPDINIGQMAKGIGKDIKNKVF